MDDDALEREAHRFITYESRIVACELEIDRFDKWIRKYEPIVDKLRDSNLLAADIANRVAQQRRSLLTKVTVFAALAAVFIPPVLTALLVKYGI